MQFESAAAKPDKFFRDLFSQGRFYFEMDEFARCLWRPEDTATVKGILLNLESRGLVRLVNNQRSGWLIVAAEHGRYRIPPVRHWLDDFMNPIEPSYYVCLFSAAYLWGSMQFDLGTTTVMLAKRRSLPIVRPLPVRFLSKKTMGLTPTVVLPGTGGGVRVSTREATALEILRHQDYVWGIDCVSRVLRDLVPHMTQHELSRALDADSLVAPAQRLGFFLEALCFDEMASHVAHWLESKRTRLVPLMQSKPEHGAEYAVAKRWSVRYDTRLLTKLGIPSEMWR